MKAFSTIKYAAAGALALGLMGMPAWANDPVKIGFVTSVTGPYADLGAQAIRAARFAVEQANAEGGIDGRMVEIDILDNEAKPDITRRQVEKLVASGNNKILGLLGSGEALAIMPLLERWNALYVSSIPRADSITGKDCKPLAIRTNNQVAMLSSAITPWLQTRSEKKWAYVGPDTAFGRDSGTSFNKSLAAAGGTLTDEFYIPLNSTDYAPYIEKIKSSGAEGVWATISGTDAITFAQQIKQFGLKATVGGASFITDSEARQLGEVAKGIYGLIYYSATIDTPQNKEFVEAWMKSHDNPPTNVEGENYMSFQVLFQAIADSGSIEPTEIATWARGKTFSTVMGDVTLREDNQMMVPIYFGAVDLYEGSYRPVIETTIPPEVVAPPVTCTF